MAKCTVCGAKAGFMFSLCNSCIQAENERRTKAAAQRRAKAAMEADPSQQRKPVPTLLQSDEINPDNSVPSPSDLTAPTRTAQPIPATEDSPRPDWKAFCLFAIGVGSLFVFLSRLPRRGNLLWQLQQANLSDPVTVISGILAILCTLEFGKIIQQGMREMEGRRESGGGKLPVPPSAIPTNTPPKEQEQPSQGPAALGNAVGTAAFGGMVAGAAAHYFAGGKMTFPIFILAYIFISSRSKGSGGLLGLVVFTAVASLVLVVLNS